MCGLLRQSLGYQIIPPYWHFEFGTISGQSLKAALGYNENRSDANNHSGQSASDEPTEKCQEALP
jgi:hypothetical protein